jgi:MFS family permease
VLQYYLVDRLHATDAVYGYWYAAFLAGFLPMFLVYGYLCQRVPFGRLLTVSAWVAVPQAIPLAFLHSPMAAVALAVPVGMLGGLMWAAIHDLAMRSCPPGLYGTLMMFVSGMNALGTRGGDLLGTHLYTWGGEHGFRWCVAVTTLMYLGIVFVIRRVPKQLTVTADGEAWRVA